MVLNAAAEVRENITQESDNTVCGDFLTLYKHKTDLNVF